MGKSIYEETLEIIENIGRNLPLCTYLMGRDNLMKIKQTIQQAQKQEKLLELYRQLVLDLGLVIEHDTTDDWNGPVDYEYLEINDNCLEALKTYKKIKELENE